MTQKTPLEEKILSIIQSKKFDLVINLIYVIIVCTCIFMALYIFKYEVNSCTSDPFVYGAKELSDKYETDFIGWGKFITHKNSPDIYFTKYNITISWRNELGGQINISDLE